MSIDDILLLKDNQADTELPQPRQKGLFLVDRKRAISWRTL